MRIALILFLLIPVSTFGQKHWTGHTAKDEPVLPKSNPIALCNDKTFHYPENLNRTCGHHGGVKQWVGLQSLDADGREMTSAQLVLDNLKREITGGYKPVPPSNQRVSRKLLPFVKVKPPFSEKEEKP